MRTYLRRRLNEQTEDDWDNDILNEFLNIAVASIHKQIRKVDPEHLLYWEYRDTVAGTSWYEKPEGTRGVVFVGLKGTAAATTYTRLERRSHHVAREITGDEEAVYCHRGEYIGIFPAPTTAVTNGIELIHAPTPELSADTDVPKLEVTLQYAAVCWAALIAKGESPEADNKDADELRRMLAEIPDDYGLGPDLGQPILLSGDVSDARGRYGNELSNDKDPGRI
jgi:hypothetical protein